MSKPAAVTAFNPNHLDELAVTRALAEGRHKEVLQAFFSEPLHAQLGPLAQQALSVTPPRQRVVYLLPGLLGSRLMLRSAKQTELLWLDPHALLAGKLAQLAIGRRRNITAGGVMLPGYLLFKLVLQAAGFNVRTWAYDWRRSIVDLGRHLAEEWLHDAAEDIMVVGHSMGGLVARAALKHGSAAKVSRVIQLGTPNQGAWAMLQVLRGVYPTVLKLGAVDQLHDTATLTEQVFHSFYSFYEMLPQPAMSATNWLELRNWPHAGLQPRAARLQHARRLPRHLAAADQRCHAIIGTGQLTVADAGVVNDELRFDYHADGDGTVAVPLAHWQGARHWYVPGRHGLLPLMPPVCQAVVELLHTASTQTLAATHVVDSATAEQRTESALRSQLSGKVNWEQLPLALRRELLEPSIPQAFIAAQRLG